jgi:hypothetical protein
MPMAPPHVSFCVHHLPPGRSNVHLMIRWFLTLPRSKNGGFLVQRASLPRCPHRQRRRGSLSPSVRRTQNPASCQFPCAPRYCRKNRSVHPLEDTIWPLGEHALSCEILRWLFHSCLANTVVFLPLALCQRTQETRFGCQGTRTRIREFGALVKWFSLGSGLTACGRQAFHPPLGKTGAFKPVSCKPYCFKSSMVYS